MTTCDVTSSVRNRYSEAAKRREDALCCPVDYDARYLQVIPQEVIDRDYGCGDPSRYLHPGETVLDLGCGGGKICFIAAQVVGPEGRVIGVDMNDDMLELARRSATQVTRSIGYDNLEFRKGKIQDLAIDREKLARHLQEHPVHDDASLQSLESMMNRIRHTDPLIADQSIDAVVSNCVLNLVDTGEKELLFDELYRVLRPGGRAIISDIVSDVAVPAQLQADPELWSGCLAGAFQLEAFLEAFEQAGLVDVQLDTLQSSPWRIVDGICFRSATVVAYRPQNIVEAHDPACEDDGVGSLPGSTPTIRRVYRGPFRYAVDDQGVMFTRGQVCHDTTAVAAARPALAEQFASFETSSNPSEASSNPSEERQIVSGRNDLPQQPPGGQLPTADGQCCGDQTCC